MAVAFLVAVLALLLGLGGLLVAFLRRNAAKTVDGNGGAQQEVRQGRDRCDRNEPDRTQGSPLLQGCQLDQADARTSLQVPVGVPLRPVNRAVGDGMRRRWCRRAAAESDEEEEEEVRCRCFSDTVAGVS